MVIARSAAFLFIRFAGQIEPAVRCVARGRSTTKRSTWNDVSLRAQVSFGIAACQQRSKTLGARTIFNLLGPLVNPARPPLMLLGVADPALLVPVATVLQRLGCRHAYVVHGSGVDEVAIHGTTKIVHVKGTEISEFEVSPADFGSESFALDQLTCHDAKASHQRSIDLMSGGGSDAERAAVAVNVAMLLRLFGNDDLKENFASEVESLKAGQPMERVQQMVAGTPNTGLDC